MIIQMDTRFHRLLHRLPVRLFKALLRACGNVEKATVLRIKTLQNRVGDKGFSR